MARRWRILQERWRQALASVSEAEVAAAAEAEAAAAEAAEAAAAMSEAVAPSWCGCAQWQASWVCASASVLRRCRASKTSLRERARAAWGVAGGFDAGERARAVARGVVGRHRA